MQKICLSIAVAVSKHHAQAIHRVNGIGCDEFALDELERQPSRTDGIVQLVVESKRKLHCPKFN